VRRRDDPEDLLRMQRLPDLETVTTAIAN